MTIKTFANTDTIAVYYVGGAEKRLVGRLTMDGRRPAFGYDTAWLADGLPLSPLEMPLENGKTPYYGEHATTQYLCGLLADSLPDGWGMLLMDRFFRQQFGASAREISVLDRFAYIGQSAMGALVFEPEHNLYHDIEPLDLATLAHSSAELLAGQDVDVLRELLLVGGSPQGARPKAMVYFDAQTDTINTAPTPNAEPWLVKFPAQNEHKDVCKIEAIYAKLAKQAGINMPEHRYFDIDDTHGAFGVKRFDRVDGKRLHIHTLAGLLNTDFRLPTLDYTQWLRCVRAMTHSQKQVDDAFRQAIFNIIFNNKDDHSKNFSFIMNHDGQWSITPAYDITYNTGTNGYHQMDVCGEAKHPTRDDVMSLAKMSDVKPKKAQAMIDDVLGVVVLLGEELRDVNGELAERVLADVRGNVYRLNANENKKTQAKK